MLDIIARLLVSASIMIGTAYLPSLAPAAPAQVAAAGASAKDARPCQPRRAVSVRACIA